MEIANNQVHPLREKHFLDAFHPVLQWVREGLIDYLPYHSFPPAPYRWILVMRWPMFARLRYPPWLGRLLMGGVFLFLPLLS
jgi:hypothetical protein